LEAQKRGLANVVVHGSVPHRDVPAFLWHADVLLLPPSAKHPSAAWTSPVKLGEYLASGTPIVASDIPALRLWIDVSTCRWFKADDGGDLARAIEATLAQSPADRSRQATTAAAKARQFSYARRAERLLALAEISGERHGALLLKRASA
jgi:glycosyltransferase involved in cell wall biosynthesis